MVFWMGYIIFWSGSVEGVSGERAFHQWLCGFLEEKKCKGAETISHFRNGRTKGAVFSGVIDQGNLASWVVIDPFVT